MDIKVLAPEDIPFDERAIQSAFERDLGKLDDGLEFVASEVVIGTGRIDTLAFDVINNRPVFIEYKRPGDFDKDALIQLMDYLSWFARDENRMAVLESMIRQKRPAMKDFEPSIRVICVVADISDRIRNAIYAIANEVKIFSYMLATDTNGKLVLVPKLEVDNSDVEARIPQATSEEELLRKHPHLKDLFAKIRSRLDRDGTTSYTTSRSFRFKKERVFAKLHFRKKYIQLELRVGRAVVNDPLFTYWRQGESSWGYVHLYPGTEIPDKTYAWIDLARKHSAESQPDDDEAPEPCAV
jgi:hypothetical protein